VQGKEVDAAAERTEVGVGRILSMLVEGDGDKVEEESLLAPRGHASNMGGGGTGCFRPPEENNHFPYFKQ
jgi:hypothetical protein